MVLTKVEATTEDVRVAVRLLTIAEFEASDRNLPASISDLLIPDAAECEWLLLCGTGFRSNVCKLLFIDSADPNGRRDFVRNGPIEVTFTPSDNIQDQEIFIPITQDDINEATEGFFAILEPVDLLDPTREVTLIREGVTLVNIRDDDCKPKSY